jgi:lysophospholipase L1-like esterase
MLALYKTALAPALLLQGRRLRRTALRLPEAQGPRSGEAVAPDGPTGAPLRLLVVGDSSAAGVGVNWQHEALAQPAAQHLAAASGRPVAWRLLARSGITTAEAAALLQAKAPAPADVVVVALGVNDVTAQHSATRFLRDYQALLQLLRQRTGARCAVLSGVPPLHRLPATPQPLRWYLGQCAQRLDHALQQLCRQQPGLHHLPLSWAQPQAMARDGFHPGLLQYRQWAQQVAVQAGALLRALDQR